MTGGKLGTRMSQSSGATALAFAAGAVALAAAAVAGHRRYRDARGNSDKSLEKPFLELADETAEALQEARERVAENLNSWAHAAADAATNVKNTVDDKLSAAIASANSAANAAVNAVKNSSNNDDTDVDEDDEEIDEFDAEGFNTNAAIQEGRKAKIKIIYATTTGTARRIADIVATGIPGAKAIAVENYEFADDLEEEKVVIFVMPTWTDGEAPEVGQPLLAWLEDMALDFRVDKARYLSNLRFAVVALGSREYEKGLFCRTGWRLDDVLGKLGGRRLCLPILVDDSDSRAKIDNLGGRVRAAIDRDENVALPERAPTKRGPANGKAQTNKQAAIESPLEEDFVSPLDDEEDRINEMMLADMEDIIVVGTNTSNEPGAERPDMVTSSQRKALTKEGYKIIGTHSAVKLCRWTKHQLRGRGGCYKHTFYGITSYQCMEATPSLACANKCVFCWRHHKNPVGREWRWKEDDPADIVGQAVDLHCSMIKQMKGVPGVQPERLEEAFNVRHCALSLVGEPIMYPRINELVDELHARKISTFLVTNAQFPDAIKNLQPVTQLYVSVDAATKDALREVDRPLFKDFWERFTGSLEALRDKGQRTVYRLTLVKQWNMMEEELEGYAKLIELGQPDLIEIKAVTYCGKSDASNLTMENVPWHEEVRMFAEAISKRTNGAYGTASEHVHSCCTLLARTDTYLAEDGKTWRTWINYDRFHELVQEYKASGGEKTFTSKDYLADTPEWAMWGAAEEGFDPVESRFRKSRKSTADGASVSTTSSIRPPVGLPPSKARAQRRAAKEQEQQ